MIKSIQTSLILICTIFATQCVIANSAEYLPVPSAIAHNQDISIVPSPPKLNASSYILLDAASGKILVSQNATKRIEPASLTKMLTMYILSQAIEDNRVSLSTRIPISKKAWKTGGSRMFVKEGQYVKVSDLVKGIIVQSGNDACVAIAEYLAGSSDNFAKIMNQTAKSLGMIDSNFTNPTGMPDANQYSSAKDLAILSRAIIQVFPKDYELYKQKWFTYNGIKQPNRNRLLWRLPYVDGLKTGQTDGAGFNFAVSGEQNNTRYIAVIIGSPTDEMRASNGKALLEYGYRYFETHLIYKKGDVLGKARVYKGAINEVPVTIARDLYVTIGKGEYENLSAKITLKKDLTAPVKYRQGVGTLEIKHKDRVLFTRVVIATNAVDEGGFFRRMFDTVGMTFSSWFS